MAVSQKKSKSYRSHDHRPYIFPKGFLWGAATSAHQVEGNNIQNDWSSWENRKKTKVIKSGNATDHYNRFEEDFDLAQKMNHGIHRLSIEWSRIEPEFGIWNESEIEHYKKVLLSLKNRSIKVMLTLHHFTNPKWFSDVGGWENRKAPIWFERYVNHVTKLFHPYVDFWITINEPMVFISMGYMEGLWPPGKKNIQSAFTVFRNLTTAHILAYKAIHKGIPHNKKNRAQLKVGIAKNIISFESYNKNSLLDTLYTYGVNKLWNHYFFSKTKNSHDFIGINYYFHQRLTRTHGSLFSLSFSTQIEQQRREINDLGWEIYPAGIFSALMDMKQYNLPIFITENGIATKNDNKRIRFILAYLTEINRAIKAGADVKGYCYWSLLDNFEWHLGFKPRFGLIEIDYATMKRTPKRSAEIFAQTAKTNKIEHDLLQWLGHTPHHKEPEVCKLYRDKKFDTKKHH